MCDTEPRLRPGFFFVGLTEAGYGGEGVKKHVFLSPAPSRF
jgi:hypothetical protein